MKVLERNGTQVFRLCRRNGCCPEVHVDVDGHLVIRDDYDGEVRLQGDTWDDLILAIQKLKQIDEGGK